MIKALLAGIFLFATQATVFAKDCADLSYADEIGFVWKVLDCSRINTIDFTGNTIVSDPLDDFWIGEMIDHEGIERKTLKRRWQWSADRKRLVKEGITNQLDYQTNIKSFIVISAVISRTEKGIEVEKHVIVRKHFPDGQVSIESTNNTTVYEPLN